MRRLVMNIVPCLVLVTSAAAQDFGTKEPLPNDCRAGEPRELFIQARDVLSTPPERGPRIPFDRVHAAREQLEQVVAADPTCASAYLLLARAYTALTYNGPTKARAASFGQQCLSHGYGNTRSAPST
jgi:hypothetical protein